MEMGGSSQINLFNLQSVTSKAGMMICVLRRSHLLSDTGLQLCTSPIVLYKTQSFLSGGSFRSC